MIAHYIQLIIQFCVLENIVFNIQCVNSYSFQRQGIFFWDELIFEDSTYSIYWSYTFNCSVLKLLRYNEKLLYCLKLTNCTVENFLIILFWKMYFYTIEFYYCPNPTLNNNSNNNNTHIAAIPQLPLTTHRQYWTKLLTLGPKCTLAKCCLK